jgi:hypothetical protein
MSLKDTIERLKSKIDIIHQSIDDDILQRKIQLTPEDLKLPEFDTSKIANKLEQFRDTLRKRRLKKQNKDNIFSQLIEIFDKVLSAGRSAAESERFVGNQRLRQHVIDSAEITSNSAKTIVMDCVKSALFAETKEKFELLIGKEQSFILPIENTYDYDKMSSLITSKRSRY